jgi:hypothetical protein
MAALSLRPANALGRSRARPRRGASLAGARELHRIRLRDDGILAAVHDRDHGIELCPLLLYIVTHELAHAVRFGTGFAAFHAPKPARSTEERRVHKITCRILRPVVESSLQRVLDVYRREPDDLALTDCAPPR